MSETWTSLLAALVGAIVGGAASLAGTMLVNKQQMATNAMMRMYNELLPQLEQVMKHRDDRVSEWLGAMRRTSAVAGRKERRAVNNLTHLWEEHVAAKGAWRQATSPVAEKVSPEAKERLFDASFAKRQAFINDASALSGYLEAKLG